MRVPPHAFFAPLLLLGMTVGCSTTGTSRVDQWAVRQGGCIKGDCTVVAANALHRLRLDGLPVGNLTVDVLESDRPAAYAWPCGRIFVSRGLINLLDADELAAAIAHEVGHLTAEPAPENGVALSGDHDHHDACEIAADDAGRKLLAASGIRTSAMVSMLRKVAADTRTPDSLRPLLARRAELLSHIN